MQLCTPGDRHWPHHVCASTPLQARSTACLHSFSAISDPPLQLPWSKHTHHRQKTLKLLQGKKIRGHKPGRKKFEQEYIWGLTHVVFYFWTLKFRKIKTQKSSTPTRNVVNSPIFGTPTYSEQTKLRKLFWPPSTSYYGPSNLYVNSVRQYKL